MEQPPATAGAESTKGGRRSQPAAAPSRAIPVDELAHPLELIAGVLTDIRAFNPSHHQLKSAQWQHLESRLSTAVREIDEARRRAEGDGVSAG